MNQLKRLLCIAVGSFILSTTGFAKGNEGGSGGDAYGYSFALLGKEWVTELKKKKNAKLVRDYKINLNLLEKVIEEKVVIRSQEHVLIGRDEVDAKNFFPHQMKMILNRSRWRTLQLFQKLPLVLHEYLGAMNVELDVFKVSLKFDHLIMNIIKKLMSGDGIMSLYYFGRETASPPLGFKESICSLKYPALIAAVDSAQKYAVNSCSSELERDCETVQTVLEVKAKPVEGGHLFTYCEVTARARVKVLHDTQLPESL